MSPPCRNCSAGPVKVALRLAGSPPAASCGWRTSGLVRVARQRHRAGGALAASCGEPHGPRPARAHIARPGALRRSGPGALAKVETDVLRHDMYGCEVRVAGHLMPLLWRAPG